jgi:hypothetical protein
MRRLFILLALLTYSFCAFAQSKQPLGLVGVVIASDNHKVGLQFTFANLRNSRPFVTFPSGHGAETKKVFEDDETIVLIFVAQFTGSTETFYLNKKAKRFTLVEVGALEATVMGTDFRPEITFGTLK